MGCSLPRPPNYHSSFTSNTCSRRPTLAQISTYLLVLGEIIIYHIVLFRVSFHLASLIIHSVSIIWLCVTFFLSSIIDPTDATVLHQKWEQFVKIHPQSTIPPEFQEKSNNLALRNAFCEVCMSACSPKAKHCRACNRCVFQFDHHCIWINNCIGKDNYRSFFNMIASCFTFIAVFLGHGIYTTILISRKDSGASLEDTWGQGIRIILGFLWTWMAVLLVFEVMLVNLISLHCYLRYVGLTTYEYLQLQRATEALKEISKSNTKVYDLGSMNVSNQSSACINPEAKDEFVENLGQTRISNSHEKSNENIQNGKSMEKGIGGDESTAVESKEKPYKFEQAGVPKMFRNNRSLKFLLKGNEIDDPIKP